jgi:two-component system sensor histidine kinase YesM
MPSIRWNDLSVNVKLILIYGSLMMLFVFSLSTVSYVGTRRIVEERELSSMRGVIEQVRNNVDTNLRQIDKLSYVVFADTEILRVLKSNPTSVETLDSRERWLVERNLTDLLFARNDLRGIVLYNMSGSAIRTYLTEPDVSFDAVRSAADQADGKMTWLAGIEELGIIPGVRRIYDMEMRPVGYLRIDVRTSAMRDHFSSEIRARGGATYVIDGEALLFTDAKDQSPSGIALADVLGQPPGDRTAEPARGARVQFGDRTVSVSIPSRVTSWRFLATVPLGSIYTDIRRIRDFTIATSIVAVLLFIAVSSWVASRFTRPLREIAEQMQAASLSDWRPELSYCGDDEIAYLGTQFHNMIERINGLVAELVEERSQVTQQQLNALQAQINPHFLYNTLDVVSWMARRRDADDVARIVAALSSMMRYSISSSESATVESEINHVRQYLTIQSARFKDRFCVQWSIDDATLGAEIPKLTLQPLVENAIVHGLKHGKRNGSVHIHASAANAQVQVRVSDTGCGIPAEQLATILDNPSSHDGRGIGIANVNRRLVLVFGEEYGLSIESEVDRGTQCTVTIPAVRTGV